MTLQWCRIVTQKGALVVPSTAVNHQCEFFDDDLYFRVLACCFVVDGLFSLSE